MDMDDIEKEPVDKWIIHPFMRFINSSTNGAIVLFAAAILAIIIANSPWAKPFHDFWQIRISLGFYEYGISKTLHHWINDGLMAIFFFMIGLELKREIIAGELREPRKAVLPIAAAIGGMLFPALIYVAFNHSSQAATKGWGIPMATDIAFALGVLYLLGERIPVAVKVFLTTLAMVDDLGAVLVIAFFYTSHINVAGLITGGIFMLVLIFSNYIGVRNTLYYALIGIFGIWLAFLMSGIHPTIAAVLAAFTIPATTKVSKETFSRKVREKLKKLEAANTSDTPIVTEEQLEILNNMRRFTKKALTPLQRLERSYYPFVHYIVLPLFALSNAGVEFSGERFSEIVTNPITIGVFIGLLAGKTLGVAGTSFLLIKFKLAKLPEKMNKWHLLGIGILSAVGFTMSIFISNLAFTAEENSAYAKMGILAASLLAGIAGYFVVKRASR